MADTETVTGVDEVIVPAAELARRTSRAPDHGAENRAFRGLAKAIADEPGRVLRRLAEAAMALTGSDSAGISLLEPGGERGAFRCVATTGGFAPHLGSTMPHAESPCGEVAVRERCCS